MSGYGNIGPFSEPEFSARVDHLESFTGKEAPEYIEYFPFSSDGCRESRRWLEENRIHIPAGYTGWEIVDMANRLKNMEEGG